MGFKWQTLTCLGLGLVRQSEKSLVIIAMKLKLNCVCKSYKIVASFFLASEMPGFLISEVYAGLSTKNSVWSQFILNGSNGIIRGKLFFLLFSCGCFTKETTFFKSCWKCCYGYICFIISIYGLATYHWLQLHNNGMNNFLTSIQGQAIRMYTVTLKWSSPFIPFVYLFVISRLAMRHDTCALVAVSLNLSQRTHPVVWSLNNLPFDCSQVLAVPKPIGRLKVVIIHWLLVTTSQLYLFIYLICWYFSCKEHIHTPKNKSCHNYDKEFKSRSFLHYLNCYRIDSTF